MPNDTFVLAGDIGGTKSNLALFRIDVGRLSIQLNHRFPSADSPGLNDIIRQFLAGSSLPIRAACFGVPGPVREGRARPTNLAWGADASEIAAEFSIPHVSLLNDLEANAWGIAELADTDFASLQAGASDASGNRCVVSPGTGLGEGGLFWDGRKHRVWACEGGHAEFAPRDSLEIALLEYLIAQYGHVSAERVVSGMGIENIYRFLRDTGRESEKPEIAGEMENADPGLVISRHARAGDCRLCSQTIEMFLGCFGAEAGNMALKAMATGGVFLGGGIPAKMLDELRSGPFLRAFNDKGRLAGLMKTMPVKVVLNDQAALLGAARHALDGAAVGALD